jgi:hypothetical protein
MQIDGLEAPEGGSLAYGGPFMDEVNFITLFIAAILAIFVSILQLSRVIHVWWRKRKFWEKGRKLK